MRITLFIIKTAESSINSSLTSVVRRSKAVKYSSLVRASPKTLLLYQLLLLFVWLNKISDTRLHTLNVLRAAKMANFS